MPMFDEIVRDALSSAPRFGIGDALKEHEIVKLREITEAAAEFIAAGYVERAGGDAARGRAAFETDRSAVMEQLGAALALIVRARHGLPPPEVAHA
jgi:hypothetical protein